MKAGQLRFHPRRRRRGRLPADSVLKGKEITHFLSRVLCHMELGTLDIGCFEYCFSRMGIPCGELATVDPEVALLQCMSRLFYHFHQPDSAWRFRFLALFRYRCKENAQFNPMVSFKHLHIVWRQMRDGKLNFDAVSHISTELFRAYDHQALEPHRMKQYTSVNKEKMACWHFSLLCEHLAHYLYLQDRQKRLADHPLERFAREGVPVVAPLQ